MLTKEDLQQLKDLFMPRFDSIEGKLDKVEIRMSKSEHLFTSFVERTEDRFNDIEENLHDLSIKVDNVKDQLKHNDKRLDRMLTWLSDLDEKHNKLSARFEEKFAA